jgi:hypothetical protein
MKGMNSTGAPLVHVPGWVGGLMDGCKSRFKDCLQQSKIITRQKGIISSTNSIMIIVSVTFSVF